MKIIFLVIYVLCFTFELASGQNIPAIPIFRTSSDWGDYDNDGDLDLLISYDNEDYSQSETVIYRNDAGILTGTGSIINATGNVMWLDENKDGNLDFIWGSTLYLNQNLTFVNSGAIQYGERGDFDRDGDLDILNGTNIYINNGVSYDILDIDPNNTISVSVSKWNDYNNDGYLDVFMTGTVPGISPALPKSLFLKNSFGQFSIHSSGITDLTNASFDWGDYDSDGDMDLAISGVYGEDQARSYSDINIYENQNGTFVSIENYENGVKSGDVRWADVDSDGDLDMMITGFGDETFSTRTVLYTNNDGNFGSSAEFFPTNTWSKNQLDIIDRTNNGILEVYMGDDVNNGTGGASDYSFYPFSNNGPNTKPQSPGNLTSTKSIGSVNLEWDNAFDNESSSLYYNIYLRTETDTIICAFSNSNGSRKIINFGNVGPENNIYLDQLQDDTYYWSVQSIDNGFMASPFAIEKSFTISSPMTEIYSASFSDGQKVEWADLNNDQVLDLITSTTTSVDSWIYNGGIFENSTITNSQGYKFQMLDFDNNGFNDLLFVTEVFLNNETVFSNANLPIPTNGAGLWTDLDEDGRLDLLAIGQYDGYAYSANQFLNKGNYFNRVDITTQTFEGAVPPYESGLGILLPYGINDMVAYDESILIATQSSDYDPLYDYYSNITLFGEDGGYDTSNPVMVDDDFDQIDIGDFDNDGDFDILIASNYYDPGIFIRKNDITSYSTIPITMNFLINGGVEAKYGDINNDGYLDVIAATDAGFKIYLNYNGVFKDSRIDLGGISATDFAIADYDRDGDLDIAVIGSFGMKVFQNNIELKNAKPAIPNSLNEVLDQGNFRASMSWSDGSDNETPIAALQYNLEVRLNDQIVVASHSDVNGTLSLGKYSNMFNNKSFTLNGLTQGKYSWKVQTIDNGQQTSPFSEERFFYINEAPTDITLSNLSTSESLPTGVVIGVFSTSDANTGDSFSYSFVSGVGDTDNASFIIVNDQLQSNGTFDFETKNSLSIRVRSFDNLDGYVEKEFAIILTDSNDEPIFNSIPITAVLEDVLYSYNITSSDPDTGDTRSISAPSKPEWLTLVDNTDGTATLSGTPFDQNVGEHFIQLSVTDELGAFQNQLFSIIVTNTNDAPTFTSTPITEAQEDIVYSYNITTSDPDVGDTRTISPLSYPPWLNGFTDNGDGTATISGTPLNDDVGINSITLQVADLLGITINQEFDVDVENTNDPPHNILSNSTDFAENLSIESEIITLSTEDQDVLDTHTYSLVSGDGDMNNSLFTVTNDRVYTNSLFDFETAVPLTIRIQTEDQSGSVFSKALTLKVIDANDPPTDISLSNNNVLENQVVGTVVGLFNSTDVDNNESFTYSLALDVGYGDNDQFSIDNNQLLSAAIFQLSLKNSYTLLVRTTDLGGFSYDKEFIITVSIDPDAAVNPLEISDLSFSSTQSSTDDQNITFSIAGGKEPYQIIFKHKTILDEAFTSTSVTSTPANDYSFSVSNTMLGDIGVEFEIEVADILLNTDSKSGKIYKSFNETQSPALPFEKFGGTDISWNLFTIPYDLVDKSVGSIFANYDPARHTFDWKIVRYRSNSNDYVNFNTGQVKLGEAYWFNAKENLPIKIGAGQTTTQIPFPLSLAQGWNLIGNPYTVSISWNQVVLDNASTTGVGNLQVFNGSKHTAGDVMAPFTGGFVFSDFATTIEINPLTSKSGGRIGASEGRIESDDIDGEEWMIPLNLISNNEEDILGGFGMHPEALALKDYYDAMSVPRFFDFTDMYTEHVDYFYPWFSTDVVPTSNSYTWTFNVESNKNLINPKLTWNQSAIIHSESHLYLLDMQSGKFVDMKAQGSHPIRLAKGISKFEVYYSNENNPLLPNDLILGTAYPNPAKNTATIPVILPNGMSETKIKLSIYDIKGQLISTLADGLYAPGFYEFTWNISGDDNRPESGLFIYRLSFNEGSFPPIQKKLILR